LMIFDGISMVQARAAMINSLQMLFGLFSLLSFFMSLGQSNGKIHRGHLVLAGIFFGLSLATKLVALNLLLIFIPVLVVCILRREKDLWPTLGWGGICLILIPFLVFFCVHLPILSLEGQRWSSLWDIWAFNFNYHATMRDGHPYASKWWSWPLMLRPIWFSFQGQYHGTPGATYRGIICLGNPAIFWVIPFTMGYMLIRLLRRRAFPEGVILLGFLSQWLSFALANRLTLFHYFYSAIPFVNMALALTVYRIWQKGRIGKAAVILYLILVGGMFIFWYPLWIGLPVTPEYYGQHMWLPSWI
jgi:dolichyl-phosphate-mannose-protein mannosyltransferase